MSAVLNKENVIELLERAVNEKGADYVDPNALDNVCEYADLEGNPLCIVGHVLGYLGEPFKPTVHEEYDGSTWTSPWGTETDAREAILISDAIEFEDYDVVASVLFAAQKEQDNRGTWGEALEAAKKDLAEGDRD